jgi:hypothetical protein
VCVCVVRVRVCVYACVTRLAEPPWVGPAAPGNTRARIMAALFKAARNPHTHTHKHAHAHAHNQKTRPLLMHGP